MQDADRRLTIVIPPPLQVSTPHLGVGLIAEYLASQGWSVEIIDANLEIHDALSDSPLTAEFWQRYASHVWSDPWYRVRVRPHVLPWLWEVADRVSASQPPLIAIACSCRDTYGTVTDLVGEIRRHSPNTLIVGGGQGLATAGCRAPFARELFDYIVLGDGEETLDELARLVCDGETDPSVLTQVPGVLPWRGAMEDPFATFVPRVPRRDPGEFPAPTFSAYEMDRYPAVPMLLSRGCVSRCKFCSNPTRTGQYRRYSAQDVFDAMLTHVRAGRTSFRFNDLLINGDIPLLEELADLILESGIDIAWSGSMMIRKQMSSALLVKLRRAGMSTLAFGVESFSDDVLRRMGKRYDYHIIARVLRETRAAGLATAVHLVLGFPGETEESFQLTLDRILSLREHITTFGVMGVCALPDGSEVGEHRERFGIQPPGDGSRSSLQWLDENGVGYEQRLHRLQRAILTLSAAGYDFQPTTVSEAAACNLIDPSGREGGGIGPWLREAAGELGRLGIQTEVIDVCEQLRAHGDPVALVDQLGSSDEPAALGQMLDALVRTNAACTVIGLERWYDPQATALAEAIRRADPSLVILAAGPDLEAVDDLPPHFDGVVVGEVGVGLREFVQSSLVSRRAHQSLLAGRVQLARDPVVLPALWRRDASLARCVVDQAAADGSRRVALSVRFERPVRPLRVELAQRWSAGDDRPASQIWRLPSARVRAGQLFHLEAELPAWTDAAPPKFMVVTVTGRRGEEAEELLYQLIEIDKPVEDSEELSPYDGLIPLSRALGRERVLASDLVRRATAREHLSPVGRVLADNIALVEKVVTALVTSSDTVMRGWQLTSFNEPSTVEDGFCIELSLRDGEDELIVHLLPGDSAGGAFVEKRLVKIRYAQSTKPPTPRQRDGLAVLGSMLERYLANAARVAGVELNAG